LGGCPAIGSGEIKFDGLGNLSGHGTYFDEVDTLAGTYQVNPDGTGTAIIESRPAKGASTKGAITFQIKSEKEVSFVSQGLPVDRERDWASAGSLQTSAEGGIAGVMRKQP